VPVFHRNFPRLMEEAQVERSDLAEDVGVQPASIAHWLKGRNYPLSARIPDIAKALGVSVADLIGEIQP
jgi:transcriptional regulator with XRE-family HTH domain